MQNNPQNNRYNFFSFRNASGLGKVLLILMWQLLTVQALQQFCQIVFSVNDSEEMPQDAKPYLPFIMALICVLQSTFIFSRKELEKNIKKLDNAIKQNKTTHTNSVLAINETIENPDNQTSLQEISPLAAATTQSNQGLSSLRKIYLGGNVGLKLLSIVTKAPVTYLLNMFEAKILLTDPLLLNWSANSLQVQVIKHVLAGLDTLYDLGTENAATIESLIKTINPHYSPNTSRKCHCNRCCGTTVLAEAIAVLGASGHSAKEAFAFCLFLVGLEQSIPVSASIAGVVFLAMTIQNYAFQGREFVKYTTQFIDYVIGAPTDLKQDYIKIKDPVQPLTGKQKALLAAVNIGIGLLVTLPSAVSHFILARLTLKEGGEAFWKFWTKEAPSPYYKELIDKISYIGVADAITDAGTESVETHAKTTKKITKFWPAANDDITVSANEAEETSKRAFQGSTHNKY